MKIVHLARLYFPHVGGVEKHLEKINEVFINNDYEVTVITQQYDSQLPFLEEKNEVLIVRLKNNNKKNKFKFKFQTWKEISKHLKIILDADVIHIHDVMWWLLPFYPLIWKKVYITFHGYEGNDLPTWAQVFWHRLADNLTKGNICVGGFHKKWYGVKPTITTFGAVENIAKKSEMKMAKNKILYIGRLAEDNGILKYLEALNILKENGRDFSLDVYGDGPLLKSAQKYSKKNKLNVVFYGFVPNAQKYISKYEIVFASRYLGILEAMSENKKVIAQYNNFLTEDYLRLTPFKSWITISSNGDEIAKTILEKKDFVKIKKASSWAKKQTWKKMAEHYFNLWGWNK